jgi:hypothetical protein
VIRDGIGVACYPLANEVPCLACIMRITGVDWGGAGCTVVGIAGSPPDGLDEPPMRRQAARRRESLQADQAKKGARGGTHHRC